MLQLRLRNLPIVEKILSKHMCRHVAFGARLIISLVKVLRHRALDTIEDALNDEYLKERRTREFLLSAAANQIIYGAYPLWNILAHDNAPEWSYWRRRFGELAVNDEVSEQTKSLLRQAVQTMDQVMEDPDKSSWGRRRAEQLRSTCTETM